MTLALLLATTFSATSDASAADRDDYNISTGQSRDGTGDQLEIDATRYQPGTAPAESREIAADPATENYIAVDAIGTCNSPRVNWIDPCDIYDDPDPGEPDVTLTDVARFLAARPALTGDPVGYGLRNAPANIIATASEQTYTGELFARPVQVRFVPVSYTFEYGDGATRTSDTGGATWDALGVAQFTPTATTHSYRERGTYTVVVTVAYAPFVDFGSGWRPVAGTVSATSSGYGIQIVEARTALVEHDCNEDPAGVGCPSR